MMRNQERRVAYWMKLWTTRKYTKLFINTSNKSNKCMCLTPQIVYETNAQLPDDKLHLIVVGGLQQRGRRTRHNN